MCEAEFLPSKASRSVGGNGVVSRMVDRPADERVVAECLADVAPAAAAFQSRWRLSTLKKIDPELYARFVEQQSLYETALLTAPADELREQASAMVRGWRAAVARLEAPLIADDAYQTGYCGRSGTTIVIGEHKGSVARVQASPTHPGLNVLFFTPDELATLVGSYALLTSVKAAFPDAEVLEPYPEDAA